MVAKLLRHDLRYLSKVVLIILIVIVAATAVGTAAAYTYDYCTSQMQVLYAGYDSMQSLEYRRFETMSSIATLVGMLAFTAVAVAPVVMLVFSILRFYRNVLTDEGYLTLTLPAQSWQVVLAKFLAGFIFTGAAVLLSVLATCIMEMGLSGFTEPLRDTFTVLALSLPDGSWTDEGVALASIIRNLGMLLAEVALALAGAFCALVLGARVAVRNKMAAGIGFMLLFDFIVRFLFGIIVVVMISGGAYFFDVLDDGMFMMVMNTTIVFNLILVAGFLVWSTYQIRNKLDLS